MLSSYLAFSKVVVRKKGHSASSKENSPVTIWRKSNEIASRKQCRRCSLYYFHGKFQSQFSQIMPKSTNHFCNVSSNAKIQVLFLHLKPSVLAVKLLSNQFESLHPPAKQLCLLQIIWQL